MTPSNGGTRTRFTSQASILSQPDLLSPDELFSQYTVNEIQRNHKKIQRDIESKKSELRTMVGERYRELINTADTIASMERTVKSIQSTLSSVESSCKLEHTTSLEKEEEHSKKEEFWSIASQMKLLVDTPEKIWHAMENTHFLIAGQLYLLSRHIVTNLHIGSGTASQLLSKFPVLPQQWGAISHFKSSILQGCRDMLDRVSVTDEQFTDTFCTIILLEGVSLEALLQEFVAKRLSVVSQHLTAGGSVRNQLADCVESITCTLQLLYNNIVTNNNIADKLKHLCHKVSTIQVISVAFQQETGLQSITRHLPTLVHSYRPTLNSSLELPPMEELCVRWCNSVTQIIHDTLHCTLHHVNSVSSVATLAKPYCQKSTSEWDGVCQAMLGGHVRIWEDLLMNPMNNHVNSIISTYLTDALHSTNTDIAKCLEDPAQADISDFVWDMDSRRDNKLHLKAEGFTVAVYALCSQLNDRLSAVYTDIVAYTGEPDKARYKVGGHVNPDDIFTHVHSVTHECVSELARHISHIVPDTAELNDPSSTETDKLVILSHICRCIVKHTPQLRLLLTPRGKGKFTANPSTLYEDIELTKSSLLSRYGQWLATTVSTQLSALLGSSPLAFATVWEETVITEESEDAGSVESKILLPIFTSSYITTVLYAACAELYRVGCHGWSDADMGLVLADTNDKIISVYDVWLKSADVNQNMALQYWLDFKYTTAMFNCSTSLATDRNKKITSIIRRIEGNIDPFDWDVFHPHLTANLHALIRRTYNLYGAVSRYSSTVQAIAAATRTPAQQNSHNILPTHEMVQRFSLLPVRQEDNPTEDTPSQDDQLNSLCRTLRLFSSPLC